MNRNFIKFALFANIFAILFCTGVGILCLTEGNYMGAASQLVFVALNGIFIPMHLENLKE